ncbi:MAG: hypothetical protein ACJ796_10230 [Gemmatimonadaceae bacterium]
MSEHMESRPATENESPSPEPTPNGSHPSEKNAKIKWMPLAFDLEGDDRSQSEERGEVF